jgi:Prealbumin-like fold domain
MRRLLAKRPFPRGRRRWVFVVAAAAAIGAMGVFIASAFGVLSGSPSKFEANDGNMVVNTTGNSDWNSVNFFHQSDIAASTQDDSFTPGQKQDTVCPDSETHKNSPKDDFTDVASYNETNTNSASPQYLHTFLYGATIRYTANGTASENVELKQGLNGNCGNGLLARTVGDKLIGIDYTNGGANVNFAVLTWIDGTDANNPTCFVGNDNPPCWGAVKQTLSANAAEGLASQSAIAAADNPISGQDLVAGQFAEFGVDLTAAGIIPLPSVGTPCKAFPQTVWESRASGTSFVSTTKDVSIENHVISNCGEIKIIKQTNPRGIDKKFSFTSNLLPNTNAGGVACFTGGSAGVAADGSFCLNDAGNAGKVLGSATAVNNSTGNTVDENNLNPGTYTVTEGADPSGFAFASITCTGGGTTVTGRSVSINLTVNGSVVCIFQNNQQTGALKIVKKSSKAAATPLSGAKFTIKDPNGNALAGSPFTTDSNGVICKDGITLFGDYKVQETQAPTGYSIDDSTEKTVTVTATNAKCSDSSFGGQVLNFTDTPLTDLTVHVASEVSGGTKSRITCTNDTGGANIGNSPQPSALTVGDPETVTANGLKPGNYTCKVFIDP